MIRKEEPFYSLVYSLVSPEIIPITEIISTNRNFSSATYSSLNTELFNPFRLDAMIEVNEYFSRLSVTFNYTVSYKEKGRGLDIRIYGGGQGWGTNNYPDFFDSRMRMSGQNGSQDFLFDE